MEVRADALTGAPVRQRVQAFAREPAVYAVMAGYALLSTALMVASAVPLTAEHGLLIAAVLVTLVARARPFVWDWMPFLFVAVMFEDLGTAAGRIIDAQHVSQPIGIEHFLFAGNTAGAWLQTHLHASPALHWWDVLLGGEYLSHFAAPVAAAVWLWCRHRRWFGTFVVGYVLLMAVGFVTNLIYPETPPWLAAQRGILPPLDRIVVSLLNHLGGVGTIYAGADPEPNGAMPALHVALPVLITTMILAVHRRRLRYWAWIAYPLTMSFAVVYLGEHYVVDVVAGVVVGGACFVAAYLATRRRLRAPSVTEPSAAPGSVPLVT